MGIEPTGSFLFSSLPTPFNQPFISIMVVRELFQGVLRLVEYVTYSNGRKVKRVLNSNTGVPEEIIVVSKGSRPKGKR